MLATGNILKTTNCGQSCAYSKINTFCLDCPRLMCKSCESNLHKNMKHNIIIFQNVDMEWDNKELITGLFEDRNMALSVHREVTRKVNIVIPEKKCVQPVQTGGKSVNGWVCEKCTFLNEVSPSKCEMCHFFRVTTNNELEYRTKLDSFGDVMCPSFFSLDKYDGISFEHVIQAYLTNGQKMMDLSKWFKQVYRANFNISVINEVIDEHNHHITMNDLRNKYIGLTKAKNRQFLEMIPETLVTPDLLVIDELLEPAHFNVKVSVPGHMLNRETSVKELWEVISQKEKFTDRQKRMLIIELNLPSSDKVEFIRAVMNNAELGPYIKDCCPNGSVKIEHFRQAIVDQIEFTDVIGFLKKECCICSGDYPMPQMQLLLICSHEFCKECFKQWLESNITSRYPCKWGCPVCPDEYYLRVDKNLHYYNLKEFLNENKCDKSIIKMFDEKLLNERLMKSENFHWCANDQCVNGFEAEGENMKVQCPSCHLDMCVQCNREWKKEHENTTCQEYEMWILKNDPDLAKVLNDIGIECPNCQMRYALAPGGCLHFECKTCGWVFCGACYSEFTSKCKVVGCALGTAFHAHHPRNCLYYLRDNDPKELEAMLKNADYPKLKDKPEKMCPFIITEEKSYVNRPCGVPVFETSGLCEPHYKEYMVQFINRLKIDPANTATSGVLNLMLFQGLQKQLKIVKGETENAFVIRLRKEVQNTCKFYIPKGLEVVAAPP